MVMFLARRSDWGRGFASSKLLIVMAIFAVLISTTIAVYQRVHARAEESAWGNNLFTLRTAIDEFTYDKQRAPRSLQELVSSGYLRTDGAADSQW